jgi:methionyl-tRNA synthetase
MPKTFSITTAIDYTNSAPHVGHAYEKVLADVIARYYRLKGVKVFFLTGVDQHGQKVQQSAAQAGLAPAEFVEGLTQKFVDLWEKLDVKYDEWAETTDERHKRVVRGILQRLHDDGQIYKDKQSGYYSVRQEQFLTDKERGPDGEFGSEWGQVEFREEENYYFKLSQHKAWLLAYIDKRQDAVIPDFRQTELRNAVERLSGDLCISRPKSRLDWGIELPFDKDFVTYVWFDALTNYISFSGYDPNAGTLATGLRPVGTSHSDVATKSDFDAQPQEFRDRWPALQVIGKDIMIPAHGIYWPIMLHALGFPDEQMPKLLVHGWWNLTGAKISKSAGNVVDPNALADKYGAEALRYYLMSDMMTGKDADFSEERLGSRYESDLANNLGNLLNRTLNMAARFCASRLSTSVDGLSTNRIDVEPGRGALFISADLRHAAIDSRIKYTKAMDEFFCHLGPAFWMAGNCNTVIEQKKPWQMAKNPGDRQVLATFVYDLCESLRIIAILVSPVLPKAAHGIFDQLNWKMELGGREGRFSLAEAEWGKLPEGHVVGKPVPLFPRVETSISG